MPLVYFPHELNNISLNDEFLEEVKNAYPRCKECEEIINKIKETPDKYDKQDIYLREGLLFCNDRIWIPDIKTIKQEIYENYHDKITAGHPGAEKTYSAIARNYYWPNMVKQIKDYVRKCIDCQTNKARSQRPFGQLENLPIPKQPWKSISIDYITGLPVSSTHKYDAILVVVDRLSKMAHFIPTHKTVTAVETANLFLQNIFRLHGLPKEIISDRDTNFTSIFWTHLMKKLDIERKLTTAFHLQANGQVERINRILVIYECTQRNTTNGANYSTQQNLLTTTRYPNQLDSHLFT